MNILQVYGNEESYDGAPIAVGEVDGLLEGSLFLGLRTYYEKVSDSEVAYTHVTQYICSMVVSTSYCLDPNLLS